MELAASATALNTLPQRILYLAAEAGSSSGGGGGAPALLASVVLLGLQVLSLSWPIRLRVDGGVTGVARQRHHHCVRHFSVAED